MDKKRTPLKQIRTFQGDVADALQKQQESLASIQQVEHLKKKKVKLAKTSSVNSKKRKEFFYLLLGSLLLLALSAIGVWYAYNEYVEKTTTPPMVVPANRFIYADTEVVLNITAISREDFIKTLSNAIEGVPEGKLSHIVLKKNVVRGDGLLSSSEFLDILKSQAPGNLIRALNPLFMFGAIGENAFLIMKLASFENAYAGMLAWEKNLNRDIGPLFATAKLSRSAPSESTFIDLRDKNKDIRAFMFEDQTILVYSFLDNNTLIIADNVEILGTLIERLTQEKLSR